MHAVVLAGGFSTRLYPLTKFYPKALLPLNGHVIISRLLDDLLRNIEIEKIFIVSNHRYYHIFEYYLGAQYPKSRIILVDDHITEPDKRLGSIGDLVKIIKLSHIKNDLCVFASDTVTSLRIGNFLKYFHKLNQTGIVNGVYDTNDRNVISGRLGCVVTQKNKIIGFIEKPIKPLTTLTSIPYYIIPKNSINRVIEYNKTNYSQDAPGSFLSWVIDKVPVYSYLLSKNGYYFDVGTLESYNKLLDHYLK